MPRSIWTGAISFGLVNVPVKLYSAVSKKTVRFHQLHEADGVRIQQKRVCPADGEEVPWEDIVKGYEISPDRYVGVSNEELEALDPKKTKTIDIEEFVDLEETEPLYYDHPYREAVLDMIEKKAEGQEIVLQPVGEPEKVPDRMGALEASLAAAKEDGGDGAAAKPRRRRRASASNGADGAKKRSSSGRGSRSKSKS